MLPQFNKIKGIHPGAILKRELSKRNIKSIDLARSINEHPQTLNAISKEKRSINPKLSIKLGRYFNIEAEYFLLLQASFDIKNTLMETIENPLIGKIRKSIFWDTDISKIDLVKNKRFIIQRILERGTDSEINELLNYYSMAEIKEELKKIGSSFHPNFDKAVERHFN